MLTDDYPRTAAALAALIGSSWRPVGHRVWITRTGFKGSLFMVEISASDDRDRAGLSFLDAGAAELIDCPEVRLGYVGGCLESALHRLRKSLAGPFAE